MRRDRDAEADLPEEVRRDVPRNGLRLVAANALQSSGDQAVNASTVLPWLFHTLGVPASLTGLLVPVRESGSMLPQAFLTPIVLRVRRRALVFVAGALVQAAAVAAIALTAAVGHGLLAGITILAALAVFSLGRSLCSIASKDVQGRTVPKGERGQITGLSTTASGVVAITLGLGLRVLGGGDLSAGQLAWLLAGAALLWVLAALTYARIREPVPEEAGPDPSSGWFPAMVTMLRDDVPFRRFVLTRSLLLVSSLSPPFLVSLAVSSGAGALSGLGGFVIASGVSSLVGGPLFGRLADRSSRTLMAAGAAVASIVIVLVLVLSRVPAVESSSGWGAALFVAAYLVVTLVHTGVRMGRKTYVVDMAEGDQRTRYVAVSNSAMGLILLLAGGVSALLAVWGVHWALAFLASLGAAGVVAARRLPEVSTG
ncbi:MFS transporter [Georgenia sp. H159]|uniref:MFS transporter n=1 Tax=Georgenia sp. H159 TaxID=3076115 RepID=UPI002D77FFCF|nr:MFS transporter [Georgenia sp. H159]